MKNHDEALMFSKPCLARLGYLCRSVTNSSYGRRKTACADFSSPRCNKRSGIGCYMNFEGCSDETLIEMYRVGNEAAIEVLFERYKNLVKKKAKAMYLAGGDSEDLIQEGMIGLYKAVRDFDESREASFKTFASMCINRQLITAVAASNRKKNMPLNTYVSFELPAYADDDSDMRLVDILKPETEQNPEKLLIDREYTQGFKERLFDSLSDFEKQVLKLYMEDKDYREIALIMNKTPKSIDNALQRIRAKALAQEKK